MKRGLTFLFVLIAIFLGCKKPLAFEYRDIKNIKVDNPMLANPSVSMDLVYFNPNKFGVNLKNVKCDIFLDNNHVGNFVLDTTMHIAGSSEFTVPARMRVSLKEAFKNPLKLLMNNEVKIGAKGSTRVGKGGIFVTIPFNYEGMHKLNLY